MIKNIVEIKNLSKTFKHQNNTINIFKNLSLTLKAGELIALTGPSGSGKSTLLHMLAMLEKPTKGNIFFSGKDFSYVAGYLDFTAVYYTQSGFTW